MIKIENYISFISQRIIFNFRGGKLVDPSPEIVSERESELEKLSIQYGGDKGVDMTRFPQFKFGGTQFRLILYQISVTFIFKSYYKNCTCLHNNYTNVCTYS